MISNPIAIIDAAGITVPLYTDVLDYLQQQYRAIYGQDVDLDADTQDGQWVAILAQAINDANLTIEQTYQAYSPTYAQGAGLSAVVKINGIRRLTASTSSVAVTAVGQAGTDISGMQVGDGLNLNTVWQLAGNPYDGTVVIPPQGEVTATAVCLTPGAIQADIGTITKILTPVPGWQTVTNNTAAAVGQPIESDAQLRRRQTYSVANPSQSVVEGIQGAIASVPGVSRVLVYENPTATPDANGIPPFSMAAVVEGGDAQAVANAIALRKTPGSPTYGTTQVIVTDSRGLPSQINFFELVEVPITIQINITAFPGFSVIVENAIIAQVIAWVTSLPIGYDCYLTKLTAATELAGDPGLTYEVTSVLQASGTDVPSANDVAISYIEAATTNTTLISLNISGSSRLRRIRGNR
jgi:uncharacterized phage protein gp47/JayE